MLLCCCNCNLQSARTLAVRWFSALSLLSALMVVKAASTFIYTSGGNSVTLPCPTTEPQDGVKIDWFDYVHNNDSEGIDVLSRIKTNSEYRSRFSVNSKKELTISRMQEEDAGTYMCRVRSKDRPIKSESYFVTVYSVPQCFGSTTLRENETTELKCNSTFAGQLSASKMQWFRRNSSSEVDVAIDSRDLFEIRLAERSINIPRVTHIDDGAVYSCRMQLDTVTECHMVLDVVHSVRDVILSPVKEVYEVGDEIRCNAAGNPRPLVVIRPASGSEKIGPGSASIFVPESWIRVAEPIQISCTASNVVDGIEAVITKNITFKVTAATAKKDDEKSAKAVSSSSNMPIVAGIVIGVIILVAILLAVVCMRICKDRKASKVTSKSTTPASHKTELLKNEKDGKAENNH